MILKAEIRDDIEQAIRVKNRENKDQSFREISKALSICDSCPLNKLGKGERAVSYDVICGSCDHYKKLRKLGNRVQDINTNTLILLNKGKKLTKQEVFYLLEENVAKKEICKSLGFTSVKQLNNYLKENYHPDMFENNGYRTRLVN